MSLLNTASVVEPLRGRLELSSTDDPPSLSATRATAMRYYDTRYERWRWQVFAITWLAYAGFYLTRKSFSVAKVVLEGDGYDWTKAQMAWVDGGYLAAYAVGQFVFGVLGDRYGTRKVISTGLLASALVGAACGFTTSAAVLTLLLVMQGLCQASGWGPLAKNMGEFFSRRERGQVMGAWMTNYAIGGFFASLLAGFAGQRWGWGATFWVPAAALAGVWGLFLVFQRNRPEDVGLPPIEKYHGETPDTVAEDVAMPVDNGTAWQAVAEVAKSPMVWLLSAVYFLIKPARYVILFWSPLYLSEKLGATPGEAGMLSGMFDFAGPFGVLAGGVLSDRVFGSRRMPISVVALVACAVLLFSLDGLMLNRYLYGAVLFALGFLLFIPDSLISGTAAIDFGTKAGASTAAGIINGCGSIAAILGGTLPGIAEQMLGRDGNVWGYVFGFQGVSLLLGALLLLPKWNALPPSAATSKGKRGTV